MSRGKLFTILLIMGATFWFTGQAGRSENVPPVKSFLNFPLTMGAWQGSRGALESEIYNILGVEDYVLADYQNPQRRRVNFYLGFYQSQKEGDLIHSPRNCMPGAGWNIIASSDQIIDGGPGSAPIKVTGLILEKGVERQVVLYWFHSRGRVIASEYMQKIWLVLDSITRRRTDGSFVRLISPVVTSEEEAFDLLKEFALELMPHLEAYIPS